MTGTKYALLLLPKFTEENEGHFDLGHGISTWEGKLSDLIESGETDRWREWVGSMTWDDLTETRQLVVVSMSSENPQHADSDTKALEERLDLAWAALLLTSRVRPISGRRYVIGGEAGSVAPTVRLRTVKGLTQYQELPRPFYVRRKAYWSAFPDQWRNADAEFLKNWSETIAMLAVARPAPVLVRVAVTAFVDAFSHGRIDFRLPLFVRAADGIVASKGRGEFATRATQIARDLHQHWYVGGPDLEERIIKVYEHRNECVHGDLPFPEAYDEALKDDAIDQAVRAEYLAEAVARESLLWALRTPSRFHEFKDRTTLKDAWATGRFP